MIAEGDAEADAEADADAEVDAEADADAEAEVDADENASSAAHAAILGFLRDVFTCELQHAAPRARAELAERRASLASLAARPAPHGPDFARLAAWRLLASTTLASRDAAQRAGWDRANARVLAGLARGEAPSFAMAVELHRALGVGPSVVRAERIFTADEEYLAPALVGESLEVLDLALRPGPAGALERAFRAYVGLVTIHPFDNGNGRVARLLADAILLADDYLPLCFASPVASHVALTRGGVVRAPRRAFETFLEGVLGAYRVVLRAAPA